jgi:putative NIF3 family GTP cyclohydrolase 1 type 2
VKLNTLVDELDAYFKVDDAVEDGWEKIFGVVYETPLWRDYVEPKWTKKWNGLMVKSSVDVERVATCVFPSDEIIARVKPRTLLFTEHPLDDALGDVFAPWSRASFERMKRDSISVYQVHGPLDQHPEVSPSRLIASALGLRDVEDYLPMAKGIPGGIASIGDSDGSVDDVAAKLHDVLGAEIPVRVVSAGKHPKRAGRVAVVAGGGAEVASLEASLREGCTTYVTGNAASPCHIPFVKAIHAAFNERARKEGVAVVDGTHYGTEKPAQIAMVSWFKARGLECVFEPGRPERN